MINFPDAPVALQNYSYGGRTWVWNGSAWDLIAGDGFVFYQALREPTVVTPFSAGYGLVSFDTT